MFTIAKGDGDITKLSLLKIMLNYLKIKKLI